VGLDDAAKLRNESHLGFFYVGGQSHQFDFVLARVIEHLLSESVEFVCERSH
jgi:hypothetical protein